DQLWVVYSMDPHRDLKKGDLRLRLISHAGRGSVESPRGPQSSVKWDSAFEKSLHERLTELRYCVVPKYQIGEFEVDFLIKGDAGTKAVISCDGDRIVSEDSVLSRMERQLTLERLGWNFIRLRASEYLMDESRAMRKIARKLSALKIEPMAVPVGQRREKRGSDQDDRGQEVSDAERTREPRDVFRRDHRGDDAQEHAHPGQPTERGMVERREQVETVGRAHDPRQRGRQQIVEEDVPGHADGHEELRQQLRAPNVACHL